MIDVEKMKSLVDRYISILKTEGEPEETYKYLAIDTFQKNWNPEADDFYQMFRKSFSKEFNLLYQNSWGFIEKAVRLFPEETREMFLNLYDESADLRKRIQLFQTESKRLLPMVKDQLDKSKLNDQQDERTIAVYLSFRYPEKYILYKSDYYNSFCEQLGITPEKTGERFLHLQGLASQAIEQDFLNDADFLKIYRTFYPKPAWDDRYLMIQNILYINLASKKFRDYTIENEEYKLISTVNMNASDTTKKTPLNQILFGAPGTGKTYNSKRLAVEVIENKDYSKEKDRDLILEKYEKYYKNKQIQFTTFHQSLSYEDFIEGIKPTFNNISDEKSDKKGDIIYEVEDGIFKELCDVAKTTLQGATVNSNINFENCDFYKMSLGGINRLEKHNWAVDNNLIFLGWGDDKDFTELNKIRDWAVFRSVFKEKYPELVEESKYVIQAVFIFQKMKIGDVVIISKGNRIIDAIGVVESEYFYDDTKEVDNYQFRKVKWIAKNLNLSTDVFLNIGLSQQTIYKFNKGDIKIDILNEMFKNISNSGGTKRHVLIIDEINRGNVSSIFGELITLLEDDKRKGSKEEMEAVLPYSKKPFSIPDNVYIIGTMNTADRSVEALDTALRRRFSFIEVKPDPGILVNVPYKDVNLSSLLRTINQRIEVLIDKDHQIGHSYFIGIKNLDDLRCTFRDKIIPLLEEYFYGDFGKIGLVLGGEFIKEEENKAKFPKNFTYENDFLEDKKVYRFTPVDDWDESVFKSVYEN
ncbi:MAG: AAA family ATPase [Proteiniphilum sp.]|jgi:hypothetical protein|uniref:AAA family ATPase n=1 Tax=Proteiniphilum sp. TaxID=1926877 RepID=UPI002B20DE49|nr:AAA family ATPase [Proteiniphilum sp.]MEA5130157.1 AAA family ATPase [Proteiniphilum sp.]